MDRKNRKALALLCLKSGLRLNAASSSDVYFDWIRCYASYARYAPVARVADAINTGLFPVNVFGPSQKP